MNPNATHQASPLAMINSIWSNRTLIKKLTEREISARYRGSFLGLTWSFFNPLLMLSIYTFVFSIVLKARWGKNPHEDHIEFSLILFIGLIIHSLLSEVVLRAPTQILSNTNYVTKVVFPLEILSVVNVATALFNSLITFTVLLLAISFFSDVLTVKAILSLMTILPIIPLLLGLSWIFSSLGVYVRDISQFIGLAITALMFLAPIFYPLTALPNDFQKIILLNPITIPTIETRKILLFNSNPDWIAICVYWLISILLCWIGFWWFQKTRKGFSDVI